MTMTKYDYSVSGDFPEGAINPAALADAIRASAITVAFERVDTAGDTASVWFKAELPTADETVLDGLVAAHDATPTPNDTVQVEVTNQPLQREDGAVYAVPKPSGFGLVMCDRDFRLNTCIVDPAASLEDLKFNTLTNKEEPWEEMTLVGVYKLDGGNMVLCADQADANVNGILTAWSYCAKNQQADPKTQINYEMRDGMLYVDPNLDDANEGWDHRAYAIVAPQIPPHLGGSITVFDAYLGGNPNHLVEALSPQATVLDPAGPGGPAGAELRLYVVHPAGSKLSHTMRLVTYRAPGTF